VTREFCKCPDCPATWERRKYEHSVRRCDTCKRAGMRKWWNRYNVKRAALRTSNSTAIRLLSTRLVGEQVTIVNKRKWNV
jgi:hypothetical protein